MSSSHSSAIPALFAFLPAGIALAFGTDAGADIGLAILLALFVLLVIKKPNDLLESTKEKRRSLEAIEKAKSTKTGSIFSPSPELRHLRNMELRFFLFTLVAPAIGYYAASYTVDTSPRIAHYFNVRLFVIAASIQPVLKLLNAFSEDAEHTEQAALYPPTEMASLSETLATLKLNVAALQTQFEQINEEIQVIHTHVNSDRKEVKEAFEKVSARLRKLGSTEEEHHLTTQGMLHSLDHKINESTGVLMVGGSKAGPLTWSSIIWNRESITSKAYRLLYLFYLTITRKKIYNVYYVDAPSPRPSSASTSPSPSISSAKSVAEKTRRDEGDTRPRVVSIGSDDGES